MFFIPIRSRQRAGSLGRAAPAIGDKCFTTVTQYVVSLLHCHMVCSKVAWWAAHFRHIRETLGYILFSFALM
ncbi:hypothetical protein XELAEV_18010606mg [Xenopus laevis]|uniref:Uncharacterized protein n=1 Tax=Xenopus laevis TaxID=8355 RepID=A0A974I1P4_XENLA|nr:hypothetical protein XELAEV_18010606mg [Xenopus laevis]